MADSLETEQGRFDFYKKKLEEEKATVPQLTQAPAEVVELAMHEANRDIFPPMGFINFNKVPDGVDKEKYIGFKVDDILRGTVQYIHEFQSQPPKYLKGMGITDLPIFENSEAVKNLVAKTKTDYDKISEEIYNLEDGEETDFSNKEMKKLSSRDLHDLLGSTILDFLKEIGVVRSEGGTKQNDDLILENSQKIYDFLTSSNNTASQATSTLTDPDAIATKLEEPQVKVNETEKMEPVPTAPVPQEPQPTEPKIAKTSTRESITVIEKSQAPVQQATPEPPIPVAEPPQERVTNEATPGTTNQPVEFAGDENLPPASTGNNDSSVSTPLLDILASSSGMTSDEIAKMFQDQNGGANLQALSDIPELVSPAVSTIEETISKTSASNSVQALQQAQPGKAASVVSEPTKMVEPMPPVSTPQTPTQVEAPSKPTASPESATPVDQVTPGSETKENTATQEAKGTEEVKGKEEDPNAELLRVMRDVLKTLQGPLIVTDGKHNFS